MATLYVSASATNGYSIGSDSNSGASKALPKLTIASAITAASASDTIIVNDGTYIETNLTIGKALTINPENAYQTTIQNSATVYVLGLAASGATINLGALIFDGEAKNSYVIYLSTAASKPTLNMNGTKIMGIKASGRGMSWNNSGYNYDVTCTNCIFENLVSGGLLVNIGAATDGVIAFSGCTFTINSPASTTYGIYCLSTTALTSLTISNCTFNTTTSSSGALNAISINNSNAITTLTVSGNTFNGTCAVSTTNFINFANTGTLTTASISNNSFAVTVSGTSVAHCINTSTSAVITTLTVSSNTIQISTSSTGVTNGFTTTGKVATIRMNLNSFVVSQTAAGTFNAIVCTAAIQPTAFRADYNTITASSTVTGASLQGITANNFPASIIEYNTLTHTGSASTLGGFITTAVSATWACAKCVMRYNTINCQSGGGYFMRAGEEGQGSSYTYLTYAQIYGNTCVGDVTKSAGLHGIMAGGIKFAKVWGNIAKFASIVFLSKLCEDTIFSGNVAYSPNTSGTSSQAFRFKSGLRSSFINNTIILNTTLSNVNSQFPVYVDENDASHYVDVDCVVANNNVYFSAGNLSSMATVAANNACTFYNNNYYSTLGTQNFAYNGTSYANITLWQAAHESTATNADPLFSDITTGKIKPSSTLYHAGFRYTPDAIDFRGRPFFITPTIGAYEFTSGDLIQTRNVRI